MNTFAVGDIHGCSRTLRALIEDYIVPSAGDRFIFLGDYIDRGPGSRQVIDYLQSLSAQGIDTVFIGGNHEEVALKAYDTAKEQHKKRSFFFKPSNPALASWLRMGGTECLQSFGLDSVLAIPESYIDWMRACTDYYEHPQYLLVHGGFNFSLPDIFSDVHAMRWIREFEVDLAKTGNRGVVHGHVPVSVDLIKLCAADENSVFFPLDNGCVYNNRPGMGNLVAMQLENRRLFIAPNQDM
ncbi:MAG: metallophosphoesterase family protein [Flavobacteriales bacterium]